MLNLFPDGCLHDDNGVICSEKGYLVDEEGNIVDKGQQVVFEKYLLGPDGSLP